MNAAGFAATIAERVGVELPNCAFCGAEAADVPRLLVLRGAAICSCCVGDALTALRESISTMAPPPRPAPRLVASSGFTGDFCSDCGSVRVLRTGTCATCLDCGTSVGGCG